MGAKVETEKPAQMPVAVRRYLTVLASRGGKARMEALTPAGRSALGRRASSVRWGYLVKNGKAS